MTRKKICFVIATPATANAFLRDHIEALQKEYDVYLVGNIADDKKVERLKLTGWYHVNILRQISIKSDLKAIFQLRKYFKTMKFDAVHSVTPKAGLVCALSAWLAGVKHRTHIYTGQVWATRSGIMRRVLMICDRVISSLNNHILVDGEPQRQYLIKNHIISRKKSLVLGAGSISGVNTVRFTPSNDMRLEIRNELNLTDKNIVFSFMGRQNKEKGIYELYAAFNRLIVEYPNCVMLLYGTDEGGCMKRLSQYENIKEGENLYFYGITHTPELHLQAVDVFCMPSYREGFGTSVIEASCLGLPVICSDIYGLQDAMIEEETGLRCKVADVDSLFDSMKRYVDDPLLAKEHGRKGRDIVLKQFASEVITKKWVDWYHTLLD